jgi:NADH dehydrogenase
MQNIVILGGGLGGFYVARGLEKTLKAGEANVTLVDVRSGCVYQPFLAEVVSGAIEPRHVVTPLRRHLPRTTVLQARVTGICAARRTVELEAAQERWELPYDQLVVALGAVTKTFPTPGIADHAVGLKGVEEAQSVRNRLVSNIEAAAALPKDSPARRRLLTFVVVGGGFSGVECFAEACDLVRIMLKRRATIDPSEVELHLIEAADRILPDLPPTQSPWVIEQLAKRNGHVHLKTFVTDATDGVVRTSDGASYDAGVLVWTAGVTASPVLAQASDLPCEPRGRLVCGADLRVRTAPGEEGAPLAGVWGLGDAACVPDLTGAGLPDGSCAPTAQHAVRQAKVLVRNLAATVRAGGRDPQKLEDYVHKNAGMVAGLGTGKGIFASGGKKVVVKGWLAWLMHRGYHGLALPCWERKLRVFGDWTATFLIKRDATTTMGTYGTEDPRAFFAEHALRPAEPKAE